MAITLELNQPAPDFNLPGVDGKTYSLASFKASPVLAVIFTAVHCPTAEVYEQRIKRLTADYADRGVAVVAIQPNSAKAVRLDEMGYTDLGDSLEDMKIRAAYREFNFPFLYDGDDQAVSRLYGGIHYEFSNQDGRSAGRAIDAVLAGTPVPVEKTPAVGCSVKWLDKQGSRDAELAAFAKEPVPLDTIDLFPAVPAPIAVLCGRELLPKVHPKLRVYDNDRDAGGFTFKLEV